MPSAAPQTNTTDKVRSIIGQVSARAGDFTNEEIAFVVADTLNGTTERPYTAAALALRLLAVRVASAPHELSVLDVDTKMSRTASADLTAAAAELEKLARAMEGAPPWDAVPGSIVGAIDGDPYFTTEMFQHPGAIIADPVRP